MERERGAGQEPVNSGVGFGRNEYFFQIFISYLTVIVRRFFTPNYYTKQQQYMIKSTGLSNAVFTGYRCSQHSFVALPGLDINTSQLLQHWQILMSNSFALPATWPGMVKTLLYHVCWILYSKVHITINELLFHKKNKERTNQNVASKSIVWLETFGKISKRSK